MNEQKRSRREARLIGVFVAAVTRRFQEDRSIQTAGSLTFTSLLSLVPLITVALSFSTAFPVFDEAIAALQNYLVTHLLPDTAGVEAITEQVNSFTQKAGRLTAIGLAFLAITALMVMLTIDEAMNRIFRVQRRRPLAQRILMYWSVLTLGPVLIGGSLSMTSFLVGASLGVLGDLGGATQAALRLTPFVFTCAAFTMLYIVVPYRRIEARHAFAGGLLASVVFELAKRGFGLYIASFPTYTLVYGAFATVPIFLLWVYLSWLIVLLGATVTALLPGWRGFGAGRRHSPGRALHEALAVLGALARAQRSGQAPALYQLAAQLRLPPDRCEWALERCARLGWVARTERESWLLAREAGAIRLADVYRAFVLDPQVQALAVPEPLSAPFAEHWKHVEADLAATLAEFAEEKEAPAA